MANRSVDFWLSTEDLPKPANRETLTDDGSVKLTYSYSNQEPKKQLCGKLKSMLGKIGMHDGHLLPHDADLKNEIPVAGVAHQAGTCRFGTDPATSVLDVNCKARAGQTLGRRHGLLPQFVIFMWAGHATNRPRRTHANLAPGPKPTWPLRGGVSFDTGAAASAKAESTACQCFVARGATGRCSGERPYLTLIG